MSQRVKITIVACLQILVSAGILTWLFETVGWKQLGQVVSSVDGTWLFATIATLTVQQLLSANRWRALTQVLGGKTLSAAGYVFWQGVAVLLLQVLPSTVGGDIVRAGSGARSHGLGLGVGVVVVERVIGMAVLCVFVLIGGAVFWRWFLLQPALLVPLAMAGGGLGGCGLLMLASGWLDRFRFSFKLDALGRALTTSVRESQGLFVWGSSLVIHLLSVTSVFFLLQAARVPQHTGGALLFIVPSALLVSALPISLGGWGVREGAFVVGLGLLGIAKDAAVGISVLFGASLTIAGAVLFALGGLARSVYFIKSQANPRPTGQDS